MSTDQTSLYLRLPPLPEVVGGRPQVLRAVEELLEVVGDGGHGGTAGQQQHHNGDFRMKIGLRSDFRFKGVKLKMVVMTFIWFRIADF